MPDTGVLIDGGAAANASPHEQLRQADRLRESGQLDAAETLYREVLDHSPANRGELRETGDIDAAERQYQTLFDRMPRHYGAWLGLGFCARRRGNRVRALEYFRNAATADPKTVFPLLAAADELREIGRIEEAEAEYGKVLASHPGHEQALLGFAFCARRRGDRKSALDWFRRAAATGSTNVFYTLAIGDELFHLWRLDEAELHYRRALDDAPVSARALLGLGNCALRRGDPAAAYRYFEDAVIAAGNERDVLLSIAEALRDCGYLDRAIAVTEKVLAADAGHVRAWLVLGRVCRLAGDREAALRAFAKASEIDPSSAPALLEMAIEERALGRFSGAKTLVECAIAVDRDDMSAVVALADFLMLERDFDGALALYQQAIAGQQPALTAYLGASTARLHMGQLNEGVALLDEAEKRLGIHPAIAARRCDLLRAAGDWHAALETARESTALFPDHFWLWRGRMEIERRVGDPELSERLLHSPPVVTVQDRSQLDFLLGQIAAEKWQFTDAIGHFADALEKNSHHGGAAWTPP